jgi:HAD superfamily phosphoserine phosphatase-like hydrolase
MNQYQFLLDLDSTVTRTEILPEIARSIGLFDKIGEITERTMNGDLPFEESFRLRVELLREIPVEEAGRIAAEIPLNEPLCKFIRENRERCYIVTGNLDVWIEGLLRKIGMQDRCFCSRALVRDGKVERIASLLDKADAVRRIDLPVVAVGDGNNDAGMIGLADVGVAFGAERRIAGSVLEKADLAAYGEEELCMLLKNYL